MPQLPPQSANRFQFLPDGGEMGTLIRTFNWADSPVGNPEDWPQSLRTTVSLLLSSKFPMFLWWGPELIQFYNDAYRPSMGREGGKHPTALGQPGIETWPEIWPTIKPLIDQVLTGQESTWNENQLIPIVRNGQLEEVYWTFGYSPVRGDGGQIAGVLVICQETTLQVVRQRELTLSEQRFRNLIKQAPAAVAVFNGPEFVITLANERVLEYWDRTSEQVMNKPVFEALPETRGQGFEALLGGVYSTGERFVAKELAVTLKQKGQLVSTYIDFVCEPFYDDDQAIAGTLVVCTDITEQVQQRQVIITTNQELTVANQDLKATNEDLKRSNENLQQFAYIASHDLQEPLRKIQSFSTLLKEQYGSILKGSGLDILNRITVAGARMSKLIRDLLTYSRISTRQQAFGPVSLETVVSRVLSILDWESSRAQIEVAELPNVKGDESQLGQLFQNLLSNALKFTPVGQQPVIRVACCQCSLSELPTNVKPTSQASAFYQIEVEDQGVGFDEKYLDRIFKVFQRLHGKNEFPGTGVGLAICEKVVTNHGGAITARSQPGQGATFSVYLPL